MVKKEVENIFIIAIDAARRDHLGLYGYERDTTPNIDRLAKKSLVFESAYSVSSWTVPTFTSVFTGLLPTTHKVLKYPKPQDLSSKIKTLGERLEERGWNNLGFHGGTYANGDFGFNRGFETFKSKGWRLKNNLNDIKSSIKRNKNKRSLYFIHGFDCHRPYQPEKKFDLFDKTDSNYDVSKLYMPDGKLPANKEDLEKIIAKYDGSIRMADHYVGEIINQIKEERLFDNSLIIILADHGEEFEDHGYFDHTQTLYQEVVQVPLIVKMPGQSSKRIPEPVSLVDIPETIAQALGYKIKKTEGRSLLDPQKDRPIYLSTGYEEKYLAKDADSPKENRQKILRALIKNKYKVIFNQNMAPVELYNLKKDPSEQNNILESSPLVAEKMTEEAKKNKYFYQRESQDFERSNIKKFEDKMKDQLKKLGYF